jgi:hypothetical protein
MAGNPSYDRLISATLEKYVPTLEDNIFTSKPLLFAITNFGNVETLDGGTKIVQPLMYAELGNQGSYSGSDTFLTDDDEGTTAAEYDWKQYYAMIRLPNIEIAKNQGAPAVLRIVENEVNRAELSVAESLDELFLADGSGNGGKDFNGLGNLIAQNTSNVGGIDPSAAENSWWQSNISTGTGALSFANMRTRYLAVSEGNDFPTNIFTTETLYAAADALFTSGQRFMDPTMANQGFETIMFHGAPISFDRNVDSGYMYFLNLKYITLYKLGSNWFKMSDWIEPTNQDIRLKKILLYGELAISNRKRQGLNTGVTAS